MRSRDFAGARAMVDVNVDVRAHPRTACAASPRRDRRRSPTADRLAWIGIGTVMICWARFGLTALLALLDRAGRRRMRDDELRRLAFEDSLTGLAEPRATSSSGSPTRPRRARRASPSSTSTTSSASTTRSATPPATGCSSIAGERLRNALRAEDTVARLGGDEFASSPAAPSDPDALVERLFDVLSAPVVLEGKRLHLRASIGIASTDAGDDLLRNADLAMYAAKAARHQPLRRLQRRHARPRDGPAGPPRAARAGDRARGARPALPADRRPRRRRAPSASRRWCAGSTRSAACSARASSSRWPRRPG